MRIFAISECFPCLGRDGGALRLYQFLKALSANNSIDLACFSKFSADSAMRGEAKKFFNKVEVFNIGSPRFFLNCAKGLLSDTPFNVLAYRSRAMRMAVEGFLARSRYDLIYVYRLRMAHYAEPYENVPKILDLADSLTLYLERRLEIEERSVKRLYLEKELVKMSRYEAEALSRANLALVSAEPDLSRLSDQAPQGRIAIVENGVDCDYFVPDYQCEVKSFRPTIAFHGNMGYVPNSDAMEHFCREALPKLRAMWHDLELHIIGRAPPRSIRELGQRSGIVVSGEVEDVRPHLKRAWVYIAPLRFAAGAQIKVLEAMAMGLPVVASRPCAAGFGSGAKPPLTVAEDEVDFAAKTAELLANASEREKLGRAGRRFVEEKFSWREAGRKLNECCLKTISLAASGVKKSCHQGLHSGRGSKDAPGLRKGLKNHIFLMGQDVRHMWSL